MTASARILDLLADGAELCPFDMAERLGLDISRIYKVLSRLENEGLVKIQEWRPFFKRGVKMRAYWVLAQFYRAPRPRVISNPFEWRKQA